MQNDQLGTLLEGLLAFYRERDWEQYHSPKNLVLNLGTEMGELMEHFRWITEQQSGELDKAALDKVRDEIADVFNTLIYLAHKLGIDPIEAGSQKIGKMAQKYPADLCRGKNLKYTAYKKP